MICNEFPNSANIFFTRRCSILGGGNEAQKYDHLRQQAVGHRNTGNGKGDSNRGMGMDDGRNIGPLPVGFQVHRQFAGRLEGTVGRSRLYASAVFINNQQMARLQEAFVQTGGGNQNSAGGQPDRDIPIAG